MLRRRSSVLVAVVLLTSGCAASAPKQAVPPGRQNRASTSTSTTTGATTAPTPPATRPTSPASQPGPGSDATAAMAALDLYLQGIANRDSAQMLRYSTGAAAGLGSVRLTVAQVNQARGGTTTVAVTSESVSPSSVSAGAVTLSGTVQLRTEVKGSQGDQVSTSTLSGPIQLISVHGAWQVSDFRYDGAPMAFTPEGAQQTQGQVTLSVAFVLSYGQATAALVGLGAASGSASIALQQTSLVTQNGASETGQGIFTSTSRPTGVFTYARAGAVPTRLLASFKDSSSRPVNFDVALAGKPS